jgi:hypothetical protein
MNTPLLATSQCVTLCFAALRKNRKVANLMTKEEARRIAANIVKLPELLKRP